MKYAFNELSCIANGVLPSVTDGKMDGMCLTKAWKRLTTNRKVERHGYLATVQLLEFFYTGLAIC